MSDLESQETAFKILIEDAERVSSSVLETVASIGAPPADDLVSVVLSRLLYSAAPMFDGVVRLASHPQTVDAMRVLDRVLLEALAQALWIRHRIGAPEAHADSQVRVLCFEYGVLQTAVENVERLSAPFTTVAQMVDADVLDQLFHRLVEGGATGDAASAFSDVHFPDNMGSALTGLRSDLESARQRHADAGCSCRGHRWEVSATLRAMLETRPLWWGYWSMFSADAHVLQPFALSSGPDAALPEASLLRGTAIRTFALGIATDVFCDLAAQVFEARGIDAAPITRLSEAWHARPEFDTAFLGAPFLKEEDE